MCHVIAQDDRQKELWEQAGLFNLNYASMDNAIPLCAQCHLQFDKGNDPCFIFLPTDLPYFIRYEIRDRDRRRRQPPGTAPSRNVPTAAQYAEHQQTHGEKLKCTEDGTAIGGKYYPIFLKNYFGEGMNLQAISKPREWHGNPMVALRRAIAVLGSARVWVLPFKMRKQLWELQDLYFCEEFQSAADRHLAALYSRDNQSDPQDDMQSGGDGRPMKKRKHEQSEPDQDRGENMGGQDVVMWQPTVSTRWALGPNLTTNDAVAQFAPLISGTAEA